MTAELTSDAKIAISEYVDKLNQERSTRWTKWLGLSAASLVAGLFTAYAAINSSAESAAKLEAHAAIADLTKRDSEYDKTMTELAAASTTRIAAAISAAASAQRDAEELQKQRQAALDTAQQLGAQAAQLGDATTEAAARITEQQQHIAALTASIATMEKQVGGDLAGKVEIVNTLLKAAQTQNLTKQITDLSTAIEKAKSIAFPIGTIVAIGRAWTDEDERLTGWYRCDGRTIGDVQLPNLADRFLKGISATEAMLHSGGANRDAHTHTGKTDKAPESPHMSARGGYDSGNRVAAQDITQSFRTDLNSTANDPYSNAPAFTSVQYLIRLR